MKKTLKKFLVTLLSAVMVMSSLTITAAAEEDEYELYIGFGGDAAESGDWGYQFNSPNADNNVGEIEAVTEKIKVGETKTVSLTLPSETLHTYWIAPVLVAEGVTDLSADVTVSIDGNDVTGDVDFSAGDAWWYEATGAYDETQAIRLAGGYNEWGTQYMASPVFTTIEFTVTLNDLATGGAADGGEAGELTGPFDLYVGFGGDAAESGDWGYQFNSPNADNNVGEIEAVTETISVGETKTVSLTLPSETLHTYWIAPVLVAEGVTDLSADVTVSIDGNDVTGDVDFSAGDAWWYEATGAYDETQAIRLAGGYNEWGTQYMASPVFTTIEFTVTLNSVSGGSAEPAGEAVELTGPFDLYVGFGGDAAESGDWGYQFNSPNADNNVGEIEAVTETISVGETKTVSLTLPSETLHTYWIAPVLVAEGVTDLSADVTVSIDGNDVTGDVDFSAGDAWWYEATGAYDETQAIRLAGGYNEWGTQYMASPVFTTIEFTVTLNSVMGGGAAAPAEEEEPVSAAGAVDLDGTYHAYIGFQTPKYSFRNAFDDASYGRDVEGDMDYFNQVTGWDSSNNAITIPGTFTDAEIAGNGTYTVSVDGLEFPDGEFADQEFMNLIFLSTDIPNTGEITISDVQLKVNGSNVDLGSAGAIVSPDSVNYLNMLLQNIWNDDVKSIGYYQVPPTSMSITFTVSGFNYDAAVAEEPTEEPAADDAADTEPEAEPASSEDTEKGGANVGLIAGIVAAVVVVAGGAGFVVAKKKKK